MKQNKSNISSLSKNGFIIIRKAIQTKLIKDIQTSILVSLKQKKSSNYKIFENIIKDLNIKNEYKFVANINEMLFNKHYIERIFLQKKIFSVVSKILGTDLCYLVDNVLTLNYPIKKKSKENYHFKDWHQEIWSGADINTLQLWTPFFQKNNKNGQVQIIPGSHLWGHIPHSNRKPLKLPEKFKTINTDLNIGDVIIFATTLLHKTDITQSPRLALPVLVKNFKYLNNSFERYRNWKIFSYSEITKIERVLGNHHLSPFRINPDNAWWLN